jgi:signal transduction histidine kinase
MMINRTFETAKTAEFEADIAILGGEVHSYWITTNVAAYDDEGRPKNIVQTMRDITDRKQNEQELRQLIATKDKLFQIISHDLKSPINNVMTILGMLSDSESILSDEEKVEYVQLASVSTKNLSMLLENLLEWSRNQQGLINFKPHIIDISYLIEKNLDLIQLSAEKKKINIDININKNLTAYADENMTNVIIRNLLTNAVKFTRENGEIVISASKHDGYVEISVADNGIGMTKDELEKLFRIDTHMSKKGTSSEKGTGLGLLLSKEFVERQGGHIEVSSNENSGSRFVFTLPEKPLN